MLIDDLIGESGKWSDDQKAALLAVLNPTVAAQGIISALMAQKVEVSASANDARDTALALIDARIAQVRGGDLTVKPVTDEDLAATGKGVSVSASGVSVIAAPAKIG